MNTHAPLRVLIVEDSEVDALLIGNALQHGGFEPVCKRVETAAAMEAALDLEAWDIILCDYCLPQFSGPAALELYQRKSVDIPFISISGAVGEETVAEMIKAGAHNYVMKNHFSRLVSVVKRELAAAEERRSFRHKEAANAFLASLVESCDDAIIGHTLAGQIVSWNAGAERLFGYTATEMLGHSISTLLPPWRPAELAEILDKVEKGERAEGIESVRLRKDGTSVEVLVTISPIKNASGEVIGASTVTRDIAQRKLEESEHLRLIQELTTALAQSAA